MGLMYDLNETIRKEIIACCKKYHVNKIIFPALTYTVLPSAEKKKAMTSATASISRTRAAAGISHSTAYFPIQSAQTLPQAPPGSEGLHGCPSALWIY